MNAAVAVGAMGTGARPETRTSHLGLQTKNRFPVFVIAIGAALFACDLFAVRNKARAACTGDNLAVELDEPVGEHVGHLAVAIKPGHDGARGASGGPPLMR